MKLKYHFLLSAALLAGASHPADDLKEVPVSNNTNDAHPKFTNALAKETSPYLLQHAHNPVNWYPWGDEAFEKAKKENKPIFLSVGYSSCHWCHVMEHESFENEAVAKALNEHFVSIKVDREERPDVDEIYMAAVQIVTERGGWPMSVFLTPEGKPFYGGTYFPRPTFVSLLERVGEVWETKHAEILKDSETLSNAVREHLSRKQVEAQGEISRAILDDFVEVMSKSFDNRLGGFGQRPKFPPNNGLPLLIHLQKEAGESKVGKQLREMTTLTLDRMAMGGIHDHLGGGFHRYSTDERWLVPHFEKMLYDNALLSAAYAQASVVYANPEYARVARGTYDWVLREMTSPDGAFYSTLDADSDGEEGKFYVWEKKEIEQILGADTETFCQVYGVSAGGNFHDEASGRKTGTNILNMEEPLSAAAVRLKIGEDDLRGKTDAWKAKLLSVRVKRIWPALDDKILTAWNGLMISSLARGSVLLNEPRYKDAAIKAAEFQLGHQRTAEGRWLATHRKGQSKLPAYLDDHAFMAVAFLDLYDATQDERWKRGAVEIVGILDKHFAGQPGGGYFFTADDHEKLLARTKDPLDKAIPSGNGWAAQALLRLANVTGDTSYRTKAQQIFKEFHGLMQRIPHATESLGLALAWYLETGGDKDKAPEVVKERPKYTKGAVTAELLLGENVLRRGAKVPIAVRFTLDKGFHIQSHNTEAEGFVPTSFTLASRELGGLGGEKYPKDEILKAPEIGGDLKVYSGTVVAGAWLNVSPESKLGKQILSVTVQFQACNDQLCQAPQKETLTLLVDVTDAGAEVKKQNETVFEKLELK